MSSEKRTPRTARIMAMLHAYTGGLDKGDPAAPPIIASAKFKLPGVPDAAHTYGRDENPTIETTEAALAALEGAPVLAFPSGMAAITAAIIATTKAGDHILLPADGYYAVRSLLRAFLAEMGRSFDLVATTALADHDFQPYDMVWIETPSNPGLELCDIALMAQKAKAAGAYLVVDNTTLTPLLQTPLELGADLSVSSDTKAIAGHSDVLFGHIASYDAQMMQRARDWRKLSGAISGPFDAFLVHRGLMTLDVRLSRMCATAKALHTALRDAITPASKLDAVRYPDIGFLLGLSFQTAALAEGFIDTCPAIFPATSFGGVHTSAERRERWGDDVPPGYVRLSVGCEPEAALIAAILDTLNAL